MKILKWIGPNSMNYADASCKKYYRCEAPYDCGRILVYSKTAEEAFLKAHKNNRFIGDNSTNFMCNICKVE